MIICTNRYQVKENKIYHFIQELNESQIEKGLRQLKGNICFWFSVSVLEQGIVYLTYIWEDEESFQNHLRSEEAKIWLKLKEKYIVDSQLNKFDIKQGG